MAMKKVFRWGTGMELRPQGYENESAYLVEGEARPALVAWFGFAARGHEHVWLVEDTEARWIGSPTNLPDVYHHPRVELGRSSGLPELYLRCVGASWEAEHRGGSQVKARNLWAELEDKIYQAWNSNPKETR